MLASSAGGIRRHVRYLATHPPDGFETVTVSGPYALRDYFAGLPFAARPPEADVVHAHGLSAGARCLLRRPLVLTVHTDVRTQGRTAGRPSLQFLARLIARRADATVAVSQRVAAAFAGSAVIAPAFDALPEPSRTRDAVRASLGTAPGRVVVVTAARLHRDKHLGAFVRAVAAAGAEGWVCGDGPERERIAALARGTDVRLLGYRDDVADLLSAADVFALPSVGEAYGIAVVEALQAGLPVIATDSGAVAEIVGDAGVVVPAGDDAAFGEAVRAVVSDADRRGELAARARRASTPDPRELVERLGDVYRSVCR